jgi:hypothetical protein
VNVERIAVAPVRGRYDEGLAILDEPDVADESSVEDFIDFGAVVDAAFVLADQASARGGFGHFASCSQEVSTVNCG